MDAATTDWEQIAIYAALGALALMLLQRVPYVGRAIRFAVTFALLAFCIFLLIQQSPYEPNLARISDRLGIDGQEVVGEEVRIRMAPDGHFWAEARINGVERRMLIDSGASVTAISESTAATAKVERVSMAAPIVMQTANGAARAHPATIEELQVGNITASDLKVVVSPSLGRFDVLGMNFLSKLKSWRVEGRTLIMVPEGGRGLRSGLSRV
jgi:aspartyl protease family protein